MRIEAPIVETNSSVILINSSKNLDDAIRGVLLRGATLLQQTRRISMEEAIALVSVAGDLGICQAAMIPVDAVVKLRLSQEVARINFGDTSNTS